MDLRLLRSFVALADELHFGRAAARVHVVQAALSQHIRALEDLVGARLFDRTTRRVQLTEVGRVFLPEAREVLAAAERATSRAKQAARGDVGDLRIGFMSAAALASLPRALEAFKARYENVKLHLVELGTQDQLEALREGQLDVGFVLAPAEVGALATSVFGEEPLQAVLSMRHRLARRKRLSLRDLAGEPVISMVGSSEPQLRKHYISLCEAQGFHPNIAYEVDHIASMLGLVAAGLGISYAPWAARRLRPEGVRFVSLSPRIPTAIQLVWAPENTSPVLERFLETTSQRAPRAKREKREG